MSQTQKALFLESEFGDFKLRERNLPVVTSGHLLVRIEAVGLNPIDWKIQTYGTYLPLENYPAIFGLDISGVVVDVGEDVSGFAAGDRVVFQGIWDNDKAGYQHYTLADAAITAKIPANISFDEAASIPVALASAASGLYLPAPHGAGRVAPFQDSTRGKDANSPLVIFGGATSVGQYIIQLAKLSGFSPIIATASLKHDAYLKSLGATHVLDRNLPTTDLAAEVAAITPEPIKLIFDAISRPETQQSAYSLVADGGHVFVTLPPVKEIQPVEGKGITRVFGQFTFPHSRELGVQLYGKLAQLLEEGLIKPNRVEVLPDGLNGVVAGLERLKSDQVSGVKLIAHPQQTA
ncbi:hypothetical protein DXG03_009018 [Asterophora parasitica]|uniref:Enoyl reductase (ER) domain-containing protein n=1 Tax=Asterophora parasitica TaxID=117018 RepID=A0A9P7G4Z3_9AGAR|nr:hypothetical protein DXG03_009018 [Asterophora parasitica]